MMKNKTLKNLIFFGLIFTIFIIGFNCANANYDNGYRVSLTNLDRPIVPVYNNPVQYNYGQQLPYVYTEPTVKYIEQPSPNTQIQYIPQNTNTVKPTTTTTTKTANTNTGNYINYDGNNSMLGASAYNSQGFVPIQGTNRSDLTALSVNGSGSFMPSSVFQWILLILLIFAIVVVSRMIYKKAANKKSQDTIVH